MTKNVKIDDETHRLMSIKAADLQLHKNVLTTVLINLGLSMSDTVILCAADTVTSHVKTVCQRQDLEDSPPKSPLAIP